MLGLARSDARVCACVCVQNDEAKAQVEAEKVKEIKDECEADLAQAMPAYEAAIKVRIAPLAAASVSTDSAASTAAAAAAAVASAGPENLIPWMRAWAIARTIDALSKSEGEQAPTADLCIQLTTWERSASSPERWLVPPSHT